MIYKRYTKVSNHANRSQSAKINIPQEILNEGKFQTATALNCYDGRGGDIIYTTDPNPNLTWIGAYKLTRHYDLPVPLTIPKVFDATLTKDDRQVYIWIMPNKGIIRVSKPILGLCTWHELDEEGKDESC